MKNQNALGVKHRENFVVEIAPNGKKLQHELSGMLFSKRVDSKRNRHNMMQLNHIGLAASASDKVLTTQTESNKNYRFMSIGSV